MGIVVLFLGASGERGQIDNRRCRVTGIINDHVRIVVAALQCLHYIKNRKSNFDPALPYYLIRLENPFSHVVSNEFVLST
jgi:hypothetical protein